MKIQVEIKIPDGEYCNQSCKTGCQFLKGIGSIGQCFCILFREYLENESLDYTVCDANIKCNKCMELLEIKEDE